MLQLASEWRYSDAPMGGHEGPSAKITHVRMYDGIANYVIGQSWFLIYLVVKICNNNYDNRSNNIKQ